VPSPYPLSSFTGFGRRSFVDSPKYPSIKLAIGSLGIAGPYLSCKRNDNGSRHPHCQSHSVKKEGGLLRTVLESYPRTSRTSATELPAAETGSGSVEAAAAEAAEARNKRRLLVPRLLPPPPLELSSWPVSPDMESSIGKRQRDAPAESRVAANGDNEKDVEGIGSPIRHTKMSKKVADADASAIFSLDEEFQGRKSFSFAKPNLAPQRKNNFCLEICRASR
jgi:hypothetical protein